MNNTELSSAAYAVVAAAHAVNWTNKRQIVAVLRALADNASTEYDGARGIDYVVDVEEIHRIADELETH